MSPQILSVLYECAKDETAYRRLVSLIQEIQDGKLDHDIPLLAVVDDDTSIIDHLTNMLEDAGFRILAYKNGESFVSDMAANTPDLILLDIRLPGMEGGDVFHHIHKNEATRRTPVIFTTGQITEADEQKLNDDLKANVQYLAKPFTRDRLLSLINRMLLDANLRR